VRARTVFLGCVAAGLVVIAGGAGAGAATKAGSCPLKGTNPPTGGDVQWAFSFSGRPNGRHPQIRSTYTHGRGTWTSGRARGTVCGSDVIRNAPTRDIVLAVNGTAHLKGHVTALGHLGVRVALPVKVSASDDAGCTTGTRGKITLFASYFGVHVDSARFAFKGGCARHNLTFGGPSLHVLISRHGAQVN
jgi:hypothetical protein